MLQGGLAVFGVTVRFGVVDDVLEPVFASLLLAVSFGLMAGHLHLCVAILHMLHVAFLVEYMGLVQISDCVPHFAGQSTVYDEAASIALAISPLACCLHSILVG